MTHRLTELTGKTAVCSICGPVKVYRASKLSKPVCWEWQKQKNKTVRMKATKQAVRGRKSAKKADQDRAAYLWRQIVFERANRKCEICGQGPFEKGDFRLQAHHLVKRAQSKRLQLDPQNGAALCPGCHLSADRDPIRCLSIIGEREPGIVDYLLKERRIMGAIPFEDTVKRLEEVARMYGVEVE